MTTDAARARPGGAHHRGGVHRLGLGDLLGDRPHLGRVVPLHRHRPREPRAGGHHLAAGEPRARPRWRCCPAPACGSTARTASAWSRCRSSGSRIPFTLFPLAEQHINSAVAGLLNGAVPMFTAMFGVLLFNRRTNGPQLLGLGVGLVGVVLISLPSLTRGVVAGARRRPRAARDPLLRPGHQPRRAAPGPLRLATGDGADARARHRVDAPVRARRASPGRAWSSARWSAVLVLGIVGTGARLPADGHPREPGRPHPGLVHHLPDPGRVARARRRLQGRPRRRPRRRRRRPRHRRRHARQPPRSGVRRSPDGGCDRRGRACFAPASRRSPRTRAAGTRRTCALRTRVASTKAAVRP